MPSTEIARQANGLPEPVSRRGITDAQWRTLFNLFPGAHADSVLLVWDYCRSRGLDPLKKPCHIVPMDYKDASGTWKKRDVVMPGIYEYRITAHRTLTYLGHSKPEYGELLDFDDVMAPEWCAMTFYRWNENANRAVEFPVQVYFSEVVATSREGKPNARWTKAPRQMLTKCTEAAGLREAFPEEFGGEPTAEEMEGQRSPEVAVLEERAQPALIKPEGFDEWLKGLRAAAEQGLSELDDAWAKADAAHRIYLTTTDPATVDALKVTAAQAVGDGPVF